MFSLGNQSKLYPKSPPHVFYHITSLWGVSKYQMHSSAQRVFDLHSVSLQLCEWENKEKTENKTQLFNYFRKINFTASARNSNATYFTEGKNETLLRILFHRNGLTLTSCTLFQIFHPTIHFLIHPHTPPHTHPHTF